MNQEKTQFRLNLNGISLELDGERSFVEEMYRRIMQDIEEARRRNKAAGASKSASTSKSPAKSAKPRRDAVVWIHRCSELVHKIYMASPDEFSSLRQLQCFDPEQIGTMYVSDKLLPKLMPQFDKGQTLWAELTPAGRQKIASASVPLTTPPPLKK